MLIDFTEFELETIYNAMDDYINYDDDDELSENLIGGLSVANRVESIQNKIDLVFKINIGVSVCYIIVHSSSDSL